MCVCVCACVRVYVCVQAGSNDYVKKPFSRAEVCGAEPLPPPPPSSPLLAGSLPVSSLSLSLSLPAFFLSRSAGLCLGGLARVCARAPARAKTQIQHARTHNCKPAHTQTSAHARTHARTQHARTAQANVHTQITRIPPPPQRTTNSPTRARAQLVARVETQIRLRDGWLAEVEAARSNALLGQATKFSHTKTMILYGCHLTIHVPLLGQATIVAHKSTIMFCADNSSFHGCNGAGGNVIIQQYTHHCARISTRSNPRLDDVFSRGSIVMLRSD